MTSSTTGGPLLHSRPHSLAGTIWALLALPRKLLRAAHAIVNTRQGLLGGTFVVLVVGVIVAGPFVAPYAPDSIGLGIPGSGPTASHLLGTDELGRDVLSRFLAGGTGVLLVPLAAVGVAFATGGALGMIFGYVGGWADTVFARVLDVLLPIPPLLIALLAIARLGASEFVLILIVAIVFAPYTARVLRGATQNIRQMEFVLSAEARGEPWHRIVFSELLPNIVGPVLVEFGVRLSFAIVFVASLNFLGLAQQPPSSNWGVMAADGQRLMFGNPLAGLVPAAAIALLVIGVNLLADSTAEALSGELRGGTH